jgi:hypothetical protein
LAGILSAPPAAIFNALLVFLLLFLLRFVLKKEWIAGVGLVAIITFAGSFGTTTPLADYPLDALAFSIITIGLLRYGLLAVIIAFATDEVLNFGGVLDFGTWYAGMAAIAYVLIAAVAVYGFRISLGGRPLFKTDN